MPIVHACNNYTIVPTLRMCRDYLQWQKQTICVITTVNMFSIRAGGYSTTKKHWSNLKWLLYKSILQSTDCSIRVYRSYNVFSHFLSIFTSNKQIMSSKQLNLACLLYWAQSITLKSEKADTRICHVSSQYFSNCHIFKNTCGWWTRNIITNWSGLSYIAKLNSRAVCDYNH